MKTSVIWSFILVVAVAAGATYYFGFRNTGGENIAGNTSETSEENSFSGSLIELSSRGGNYVCTFTHSSEVAESTGTVYISGTNLRGDFSSQVQNMRIESHMIRKDGFLYTWSPMAPTGFKIPETMAEGNGDAEMQAKYSDINQAYSYDCQAWTPEESRFALPAMTFQQI